MSIVPEARGFGRRLQSQLDGETESAGISAGRESGQGFLGGMGGAVKGGIVAVAVGAGALFAAGFAKAVEDDKSNAKLGAQLGISETESARLGKVAGKVYSKGYGESVDQVNQSLKALAQNGVAAVNAPKKDLADLSKRALNLAEAFDTDVADSAKAAGQLIRTGLAKDGKEAFDLLTAGFTSGADKAGDLIDTVNEYSTQWRKAGISGAQGIGLINQALQAGARDGDIAADAIKEFSIRAVDGSKTTADGFKALRLDADDMAARFAKGGKTANGVLDLTLDKLRGVKDPVKQSQIAVSLFGTQAEDLGAALLAMDPSKAAAGIGKVGGAAEKMGKTLHGTATNNIEVFKRQALQGVANFASKHALPALVSFGGFLNRYVLPPSKAVGSAVASVLVPAIKSGAAAFAAGARWVRDYGAWLIPLGVAIGGVAVVAGASAIGTWAMTAAFTAYRGVILAATAVTRGWAVAQGILNAVMAANPVGLIVVGILALVAAAVVAYKRVGWFREAVQATWSGIKAGWDVLWNSALKPGFGYLMVGLRAVGAAGMWLWRTAIGPAFRGIVALAGWWWAGVKVYFGLVKTGFSAVAAVGLWLWTNALGPMFRGIVGLAKWWWFGVKVYFTLVKSGFQLVGMAGMWLWRSAIQPAFRGIVTLASWWWSGVKLYFGAVKTGISAVGAAGMWLWKSAIQPAFRGISTAASFLWTKGLKPAFDSGKRAVGLFAGAFRTAKDGIGKALGQIQTAAKAPVNFLIEFVYSKGIKATWDKVAGFVGLDKLPAPPKLLAAGGTVGPWGAAGPMRVNRPTAIVGEGDPRHPEFVIPTDPKYRKRALALHAAAGTQLMADGGVIGDVTDWLGGAAKKVGGAVMGAADFLSDPSKMWDKATGFIRDRIARIGQTRWAKAVGKFPLKMLTGLKDKIVESAGGFFGGSSSVDVGGSGVKRWSNVVLQALKMVGQPASLLPVVLRRMNQESGGNPRAINNWDINAKNGDPSRGLMQTIGATFNAYAGKLRGRGIYDPLANIYASMRYALSRYGSLASAYNRPGGYASGGRPRPGELAWVGEKGPELVRFGSGNSQVYDHRTSLGMTAGLGARGFASGTSGAKARKEIPGDLKAFTKSLTGSASSIAKAAKNLSTDLKSAGTAGKTLAARVNVTSARLQQLAKERDSVDSKLAAARQASTDQRKNAADYLGLGNIESPTSVGSLIAGLQTRQSNLKSFESQIKTASRKGVSQSLIKQLVAAGPDSDLARLVSGASAGQIKQLNALDKSGAKLSTSYGRTMADSMYDAGSQAGKGFLTGLLSQEKELQGQMRKLGGVLVDAIEDRLDINSPSRETQRIGEMVGAGVVVGTHKSLPQVRAEAARLAAATLPAVVPVTSSQTNAAGGLRRGDTVVLRIGEHEFTAVVDERVDAGLDDVRKRKRAGSRR
ncbi:phage tail tape measure protein [Streptomyces sp. NBC_01373]|uniref:phage tail tape measure protein n=1 Tax=Streptomyces sp. NBC_01373 TaxID=2903843 RepID=UPI00225ACA4F|nr:phage tail tape measure protein [Streptomyces sp. NBC_01373]MCX4705645.1 phage tail tape measure protein [Streptomyces sp. NBC_01373]